MTVWPKLSVCLLWLAGCRQPNPEWTGPADGDTGMGTAVGTAADTVVDSTTGPVGTSMLDASDVTEGQDCNNNNQCPDGWLCGPMGCQQGGDGDACEGNGDCQLPTGICGPEDVCQDGSADDPCGENSDCQAPTGICGPMMVCQSGEAGQPCTSPNHCASSLGCTDGVCTAD